MSHQRTQCALSIEQNSGLKFRKFHVPNGTVLLHRPDPSHRSFSYCFCKKYTKVLYWGDLRGTVWSNGKGYFVPTDQNDQTAQSGPCTFKFRSDQTDVPTEINLRNFGFNGKRPLNYWKCVSNFPSPDWHIGNGFLNFSIMALSQSR